ncbi:MAG: hypothetical protein AB7U73_17945 [Pirellulales bacterium]
MRCSIVALVAAIILVTCERAGASTLALGATSVGTLAAEGPFPAPNDFVAGVNFWASWSLDPLQTAVDPSALRWLQIASYSKPIGSPYPDPMRPFVDPLSTQFLGSRPADAEPWYDISGATKASLAIDGGGNDAWMGDGPFAPWGAAPLTFSVETFVVAITDIGAKQARILGGVGWGYSLDTSSGQEIIPHGVVELQDTASLRDAVNAALAIDYPGWMVVVPEPGSLLLLAMALVPVIACRNRLRRVGRRL